MRKKRSNKRPACLSKSSVKSARKSKIEIVRSCKMPSNETFRNSPWRRQHWTLKGQSFRLPSETSACEPLRSRSSRGRKRSSEAILVVPQHTDITILSQILRYRALIKPRMDEIRKVWDQCERLAPHCTRYLKTRTLSTAIVWTGQ